MHIANINEAKAHLSQLIKRALAGDEIVIARGNEPLVKLTPVQPDTSPRVGGQWAGQMHLGDEFEFSEQEIESLFQGPILPGGK